jgi:hypothetical protein
MTDLASGGVAAVLGVIFVATLAILYFAFRMLKRSVKMAFRMALVAAIVMIMITGGLALWWFGTGTTARPKAPAGRTK